MEQGFNVNEFMINIPLLRAALLLFKKPHLWKMGWPKNTLFLASLFKNIDISDFEASSFVNLV